VSAWAVMRDRRRSPPAEDIIELAVRIMLFVLCFVFCVLELELELELDLLCCRSEKLVDLLDLLELPERLLYIQAVRTSTLNYVCIQVID